MKLQKPIVALLTLAFASSALAKADDCRQSYLEAMDSPLVTLSGNSIEGLDYGVYYLGVGLGAGAVASWVVAGGVGVGIEVAILVAKHERDVHLMNMSRLITESNWMSGVEQPPSPQQTIPVNGATKKERREQEKENRAIERNNKHLAQEAAKSQAVFQAFYADVAKKTPGLKAEDLARAIAQANQSSSFCNGFIGNEGRQLALQNEIPVDGRTKAEVRREKNVNKKVDRDNSRAERKYRHHELAKRSEAVSFFQAALK
jgi:hypothetical protein